jgi:SH3 domain-containing YSC84-like protein 1
LLSGVASAQNDSSSKSATQSGNSAATTSTQAANPSNESDIQKRIHSAAAVLDEIMSTPDKGIPDKIMDSAKCVIVIPSEVRIAFVFGGRHGRGVATCRNANGWSAPAPVTITGGSWGLQFGGEAVDLVMLVMSQRGVDDLLSSKFKIGAGASAAAGPVGRQISADTNYKLQAEILTYSRSRGVFAGIDLNGAVIEQDKDETRLLYSKMEPFRDILSGKVPAPKGSNGFEAAVEKYYLQARHREHAG